MTGAWLPVRDAVTDSEYIILDNYGFAYRATRTKTGWRLHKQRFPTFDDADLAGIILFPDPGTKTAQKKKRR